MVKTMKIPNRGSIHNFLAILSGTAGQLVHRRVW